MGDKNNCVICNALFLPKREKSVVCELVSCKNEYKRLIKKAKKRDLAYSRTLKFKT